MTRPFLAGYADRLDAAPGEPLTVKLSSDQDRVASVDLVRVGAGRRDGTTSEHVVMSLGRCAVAPQRTSAGSCVRVPGASALAGDEPVVVSAVVMPTRPARRQAIIAQGDHGGRDDDGPHQDVAGWWVGLDGDGHPSVVVTGAHGRVVARGDHPLVAGAWYRVSAGLTVTGELAVIAEPLTPGPSWRTTSSYVRRSMGGVPGATEQSEEPRAALRLIPAVLFIAAAGSGGEGWTDVFDGKVEAPSVRTGRLRDDPAARHGDVLPGEVRRAAWDLGIAPPGKRRPSTSVPSVGPGAEDGHLDGECLNAPLRAVTGSTWSGREQDYRMCPAEYSATHFHADDLDDCRWSPSLEVPLPDDLVSGVYAVRVTAGDLVDRVPVFVRPPAPRADVALLMPTVSYLAYANDHPASDGQMCQAVASSTPVLHPDDLVLHEHREWGLSCYDSHADGSGVAWSTMRRPLLNMRPTHEYHIGAWQLPADLALVQWLGDEGIEVDVLTDHQLHREGAEALAAYGTVITGSHPEYYTTAMLDGVEQWLDRGGRLVYLGANGFYWRTAIDPDRPWLVEVRRGHAGSRAWESSAGEEHFESTGERGGLWRHLGRTPQRLTGVGYAAQGFDRSGHYRRLSASRDPRVSFVFDGVDGEVFGTSGAIGGGAAGQELDRCDVALGTPDDALVLATSEGLTTGYLRCVEEIGFSVAGTSSLLDPAVRADVVYHVRPAGGAVFATGSIAWSAALSTDEGVARITRNVINRFRDPRRLPW